MTNYPVPSTEDARIAALRSYRILDTSPESQFDRVAWLAAEMLGCPIALVSLVDEHRQWFKASVGLGAKETPREQAFCAHAIMSQDVMVVANASEDPRFKANPLVTGDPNIRFYAGAPLRVGEDHGLGTLCVIDRKPRVLSDRERECLSKLRDIVVDALEQRAQIFALERARKRLIVANEELDLFAHAIGHDLAGPVRNIGMLGELFEEDYGDQLAGSAREDLQRITRLSKTAGGLVREIARFATVSGSKDVARETVQLRPLLDEVLEQVGLSTSQTYELELDLQVGEVEASPVYLRQILANLIGNAHKYGGDRIRITVGTTDGGWTFRVEDNGPGIPEGLAERIFRPFYRLDPKASEGSGIGLAWVRKLVHHHGGRIWVEGSALGGAAFCFELAAA